MGAPYVDALLVLGGEDRQRWPRCSAALLYYQDCCRRGLKPPRLIVSGGKVVRHDHQWSTESALMVRFFVTRGVPERDLLVEPHATDTFGNVVLGGALADFHGLARVALVTDDFHHWRSRRIFMRVFGAAPGHLVCTGVKGSWRARIRERLAYWALRIALDAARVQKGSLASHKLFLLLKQARFSDDKTSADFNAPRVPDFQGVPGDVAAVRPREVSAPGLNS